MKKTSKAQTIIFGICIFLSIVLRLLYCLDYQVQPRDAYVYAEQITRWEIEKKPPTEKTPLLSLYILKIPYHFWGYPILKGGIVMNMLLGIALVLEIMLITQNLFKNHICTLICGLFAATHPSLIHFSCQFLRENTYLVFSSAALYFIIRFFRSRKDYHLVLGIAFSILSYFCRHEGLELFAVFCIIILYIFWCKKDFVLLLKHSALTVVSAVATLFLVMFFLDMSPQNIYAFMNRYDEEITGSRNTVERIRVFFDE